MHDTYTRYIYMYISHVKTVSLESDLFSKYRIIIHEFLRVKPFNDFENFLHTLCYRTDLISTNLITSSHYIYIFFCMLSNQSRILIELYGKKVQKFDKIHVPVLDNVDTVHEKLYYYLVYIINLSRIYLRYIRVYISNLSVIYPAFQYS